jgi:ATP-binding protein involved in chromosome partitioning
MIERLPVAGAVIVSSPQDLALIDAAKAVQMFRKLKIPVIGLLENMSTFICDNCGKEHHILGHNGAKNYAEQNEIPFLGEVPLHMGYRTAGDSGEPTAAHRDHPLAAVFGEAARKLVNHELLQAH